MRIFSTAALLLTGAAGLALAPAPSQATPLGTGSAVLAGQASAGSLAEKAASRGCWWRNGVRYCGRAARRGYDYRPEGYGYTYGNPKAEAYPTGTSDWWNAMEREGRTGNPRG
jgi:hypothetical protein